MAWLPKKKVVVPVDFSEQSMAAVDAALELVEEVAGLHVVHVLPVLTDYEANLIWTTANDDARRHHAEMALRERLDDGKLKGLHISIVFGDPGHQIAQYAEDVQAELIVLPSHGRTGLSRLLIGSVAERVVRLAHCPVLVLKSPPAKGSKTADK